MKICGVLNSTGSNAPIKYYFTNLNKEGDLMYKHPIIGIYSLKNIKNNKMYIGQSVNIHSRFLHHRGELRRNCHDNKYLQNDWNIFGEDSFILEILEECSKEELDEKEVYYINLYATRERMNGYNLQSGSRNHPFNAQESIDKLSDSLKVYYTKPGSLQKHSENAFKQWANPEIKAKISGTNNHMYGKTLSVEARERISKAQKGRVSPFRNTTPILCVELNKIFLCAAEASKEMNIQSGTLLDVCRGKRKTAGGYHWQFTT